MYATRAVNFSMTHPPALSIIPFTASAILPIKLVELASSAEVLEAKASVVEAENCMLELAWAKTAAAAERFAVTAVRFAVVEAKSPKVD
jgi:hypothetical protein